MSFKKVVLLGTTSSVVSIILCLIYNQIYSKAFDLDFSNVLTMVGIIMSNFISCFLMAFSYFLIVKLKLIKFLGYLNILIVIFSFVSILGVFGFQLPMEIESPELFPGLAIPMHFFPALTFFMITPVLKFYDE